MALGEGEGRWDETTFFVQPFQIIQISLNSTDGNLDSNDVGPGEFRARVNELCGCVFDWGVFASGAEVPLRTFAVGSLVLSFPATWFTDSSLTSWGIEPHETNLDYLVVVKILVDHSL